MKKILLTILFCVLALIVTKAQEKSLEFNLQTIPSQSTFRSIHVFNDYCVWLGGTNGNYCYTTNGGNTWNKGVVIGAEDLDFRDVHVFNPSEILLMSCGNGQQSRIYSSSDMGKSWNMTYKNDEEKGFFNGFDFWNLKEGILTCDAIDEKPYVLITENGGQSWKRLAPDFIPSLREGEYAFAASGTGIVTRGDSEVWIATGGLHSRIFYSVNKGRNWSVHETPIIQGTSTEGIYSFYINNDNRAIAVGGNYKKINERNGNVIISDDSGKNWKLAEGANKLAFKERVLQLEKNIWLTTGPSGSSLSTDNGENWFEVDNRAFHTMDYDMKSKVGYLAGDNGLVVKFSWIGL